MKCNLAIACRVLFTQEGGKGDADADEAAGADPTGGGGGLLSLALVVVWWISEDPASSPPACSYGPLFL